APPTGAAIIENGKITKSGEKKKRLRQKWGLTPIFLAHLSLAFRFSQAHGNRHGDQPDCDMKLSSETENLFTVLRQSAKPKPVSAIEKLIEDAPDRDLCRINALAFAAKHKLSEEDVIAAFLHGARLGIFDMSWNILCPACGGVLDSGATLKTVKEAEYTCVLCAE